MSELHKFLFEGLPVRGMIVRLTESWQEVLARRASNSDTGAYPQPLADLLGEMTAAATLMQANIKFNGSLILQIFGDGPVKVAVAEVKPDLSLRATAKAIGEIAADAKLSDMINAHGKGRCAITLDPKDKLPGQQPYQGVVPLIDEKGRKLERMSDILQHYMLQSEQLDTTLVLAANDKIAAGLLIQRLPVKGEANLEGTAEGGRDQVQQDQIGHNEDYNRISILASSLTREELLTLDVDTILRRLFWEETVRRFEPQTGMLGPHFACTCGRARVESMIRGLGRDEADSIISERGNIEVGCDFCGKQYHFDAVDAAQIFTAPGDQMPGSAVVQ
ncbi:Hsp33 family molecular chaperone HslO [Variovorax ureilyticus]|uniref:Hsp33 family molecular chaperone HslO n=1 Tax=Variovorax ureilyticus TaxID=1836198 RepID=A0ABU8VHM5_9BURK